jgi:sulfite reductase beta subunit-like hemoprotein
VALRRAVPDVADLSLPGLAEHGTLPLGAVRVTDVPLAIAALVSTLQAPGTPGLRMRDGIRAQGPAVFRSALDTLRSSESGRESVWAASSLGFQAGVQSWCGLELPFGSAEADVFSALADLAERFGTGEVRLTPTRTVLLPGVSVADREPVEAFAREHRLSLERRVPGLQVVACSGAPACRSAQGETRRLALRLAEVVRIGAQATGTLHVSGCEKSCAWGGAADITLVHAADGCRLGFGTDVAQTSAMPVLSLDAVRERLSLTYGDTPRPRDPAAGHGVTP